MYLKNMYQPLKWLSVFALISMPAMAKINVTEETKPQWDELSARPIPEWIQDAKFGIYAHWGLYSVGHNTGEWYERHLYDPDYHKKLPKHKKLVTQFTEAVGPLDKGYGYKDLVPFFTAENYDPDFWAEIVKASGANFAGISIAHHDGFGLWDSKVYDWHAGNLGPKRDLYGEFAKALRKQGVKVAMTSHIKRTHGWMLPPKKYRELARKEGWDVMNPKYREIYPSDETGVSFEEFEQHWDRALREVVANYQPDIMWLDGGNFSTKRSVDFIEHYFKQADSRSQPVHVLNKYQASTEGERGYNFPSSFGFKDFEHGRDRPVEFDDGFFDSITITGRYWGYSESHGEKTMGTDTFVKYLIDSTSRGGAILLSLAPKWDGTLPNATIRTLREIGAWLNVNGEAIFKTRKWDFPSDEDADVEHQKYIYKTRSGSTKWHFDKFKADDVRYTRSKDGKAVYVMTLSTPATSKVVAKRLGTNSPYQIKKVSLLGCKQKIEYRRTAKGLELKLPTKLPTQGAVAFKVELI